MTGEVLFSSINMSEGSLAAPLEKIYFFNGRKETLLGCCFLLLLAFSSAFLLFNLNSPDPFSSVPAIQANNEKVPPPQPTEQNHKEVTAIPPQNEKVPPSQPIEEHPKEVTAIPSQNQMVPPPQHTKEHPKEVTTIPPQNQQVPPPQPTEEHPKEVTAIPPQNQKVPPQSTEEHIEDGNKTACDLYSGRWVRDSRGPYYTNRSCATLPYSKNCQKHGKNMDFVNWRWKPNGCELPWFEPKTFLGIVHGKKMAFVGDSLARNQMESLLCLLSQVEAPTRIYMDLADRFVSWYFPSHNFTLMIMTARFLVAATERLVNGSYSGVFDIHLDKIDPDWGDELPGIHYVIINAAHWFNRITYLYKNDSLVGCTSCPEANITRLDGQFVLQTIFRTALQFINNCENCNRLQAFVRTFSPTHFETGAWNEGGYCNRTRPSKEGEVSKQAGFAYTLLLNKVQMEEVSRVVREGGSRGKKWYGVLDVTRAMLTRVDGHPGAHWNHEWGEGKSDCLHWCLPGPIDLWNDLLLMELKKSLHWS